MKTSIIQLEPHDDEISIRDKISWSKTNRILLTWPVKGLRLQKVDLVLILRASQKVGAQLALVTPDEEVVRIAWELGIPVFQSLHQAQTAFWRRPRGKRRVLRFEPKGIPLPVPTPAKSTSWKDHRMVRVGLFMVGVLAVLVLVGFFIPEARVVLYPSRETQTLNLEVRPNPKFTATNVGGGIPAQVRLVVVEGEETAPARGTVQVAVKSAVGTVEFTNLTDEVVVIPAGQIILTRGEKPVRFMVVEDMELPGEVGQKAEANIQAVQPGNSGNVAIGEIQAVEGPLGVKVTVVNLVRTAGGQNQAGVAPSEEDRRELRERLLAKLQQTAINELETNSNADIVLKPTLKLNHVVKESYNPEGSVESEWLSLTMQVEFSAWAIHLSDLETLAQLSLDAGLPEGQRGVAETLVVHPSDDVTLEGDLITWQVEVSRQFESRLEKERIIDLVRGKPTESAKADLGSDMPFRSAPEVILQPDWWPNLPLFGFRIILETR